uniref:Putative salivary protein 8.2 n=1 Tax=Anopheles funestus TaxID=62324 RepID=Q06DJ1_ANOFN|nr:putative salivary protein 8.2 [Anopheles funestus]
MKFFTILFLFTILTVICAKPATTAADKEQTTAAPESEKGANPTESVDSPDVKTDDKAKPRPDMKPIEIIQQVIKDAIERVSGGLTESAKFPLFHF